jgi:hypothetical protein
VLVTRTARRALAEAHVTAAAEEAPPEPPPGRVGPAGKRW